ncbi:DUF481 domain-containing protein [Sulfurovum sp. NBC37-1]|uniref:DUF481 domain-containing protein n=1 Tax=Sulfurovum sp. (strain NBC37-1) TaxID=387093 RepID=UPI0001587D07|nr:DUF481 domain-containing protein [Sulfurovum sp. NBC37-1]BAF72301.1 hypothetical protein SUN_1348 [Sulfurovum sp. NBC37-1]
MYVMIKRLFFIFLIGISVLQASQEDPLNLEVERAENAKIKDMIVVHGMVLYGKIIDVGQEKLSFRLLYSTGVSRFAYKDIDAISTQYSYHISFKRMDVVGRIEGIEDNKEYLKVREGKDLRTVKISDIDNLVVSVNDDPSIENVIRNKIPYISGNINFGLERETGSNQKNTTNALLNLAYKKAEHEVKLYVDYEFETTETSTTPKVENKDELVGIVTYQNHFRNDLFWYGSLWANYDRPRQIQNRMAPSAGFGYRYKFKKERWIEPVLGLAYVRTKYVDEMLYPDKKFAAVATGMNWKFQADDFLYMNSVILDGFIMYYPSIENPGEDWIFRANAGITIPLFEFFSVKFLYTLSNDSNPDPAVGNNKSTTKLLFGFDF